MPSETGAAYARISELKAPGTVRFNILGPIEVALGTERLRLTSPIQRTLLALLLVNRNREVAADRIVEALWRDDDWADGRRRLWFHVSKLRKFLDGPLGDHDQSIVTGTTGYLLSVDDHSVDSDEFERLVERGTALVDDDPAAAAAALQSALDLWRGDPYEDVPADAIGWAEPVRLNELRLAAVEARFEALLAEGKHQAVIPELENAVATHPYREHLRAQLMRALYGVGRQVDALEVYRRTRETLVAELGIDPSPTLQKLELEILQQDPRLLASSPVVGRAHVPTEQPDDEQIVGRDEPLAMLGDALRAATRGRVQTVFVSGEAGMGKTSLLRELARRARAAHPDLIILAGRGSRRGGEVNPFGVVRNALDRLLGGGEPGRAGEPSSPGALGVAVDAILRAGADLVGPLVPTGRLVAAAKRTGRTDLEDAVEALAVTSERGTSGRGTSQRPLVEVCVDTIRSLATQATVLVLMDDLQWIDAPSLDVLRMLTEPDTEAAMLVVGAFRPEDLVNQATAREVHSFVLDGRIIDLDARTEHEVRVLVDAMLDRDRNRYGESFRDEFAQRSGGNPLFVVELLNSLRTRGSVELGEDGVWSEAPGWSWGGPSARIESVLAHRFEGLDPELVTALKVASVEGVEFSADLVAATLGFPTSVAVELMSGEASGRHRLVEAVGPLQVGLQRLLRYRFRHQLLQEYAYGLLDDVERPHFHARVGTALESLTSGARDAWLGELARHFEMAAMPTRAISYLSELGTRAIGLGANLEAELALGRALDLVEQLPQTEARDETELDLHVLSGLALSATRGFSAPAVEQAYRRAADLMLATGGDVSQMPVQFGLWVYYASGMQFDRSRQMSARMAELATESGDDGLWLQALHTRWTESLFEGNLGDAVAAVEEARRTYRYEEHHPMSFRYGNHDAGVCALTLGAIARALRGEPDHASQMTMQAVALAEALNHPMSIAQARLMSTWVRQIAGDATGALESVRVALDDLADVEAYAWKAVGRWVLAWALSHEGRDFEALEAAREAVAGGLIVTSNDVFAPLAGCLAAEVHVRSGDIDEAAAICKELVGNLEHVGDYYYAAEVLRTRARVLDAIGERTRAIGLAQDAVATANRQGARALSIRAATTLVSLADDRPAALDTLRSSLGPLAGRDDVPYVSRAMELLELG